jgi:2-polyprenyl-3-methyl-5-hydroxy-6-metoxy-1,4-benzoquinol methylase
MPGDYSILATIHDVIGMDIFARHITPQIINFAQQNNWLGRQVLDLSCGSGVSIRWLAQHGYIVTGVDESTEMLDIAKQTVASQSLNVTWHQQNILELQNIGVQDLVICLDTMHEFTSLREIEQVFKNVANILKPEKLFIFDIYTIEGLFQRNLTGDTLETDTQKLSVFVQNTFDYERQIQTRNYIIYHRADEETWTKQTTQRILRSYPLQAITALVGRCGLEVSFVLNMNLSSHRPSDSTERVIIVAKKG